MDLSATETKGNVLIKNAAELLNYSKTEEDAMEKAVKEIAAVGVNVVVAQTTVRRGGAHPPPRPPAHPSTPHPPTHQLAPQRLPLFRSLYTCTYICIHCFVLHPPRGPRDAAREF